MRKHGINEAGSGWAKTHISNHGSIVTCLIGKQTVKLEGPVAAASTHLRMTCNKGKGGGRGAGEGWGGKSL